MIPMTAATTPTPMATFFSLVESPTNFEITQITKSAMYPPTQIQQSTNIPAATPKKVNIILHSM